SATIYVKYTNAGDAAMPAPILKLHGDDDALMTEDPALDGPGLWTSNPPPGLTDTVQLLAAGSGATPGILQPGDSGLVPVYYRGLKQLWDFSDNQVNFSLGTVTADDATPIDWKQVESLIRPTTLTDQQWQPIFQAIQARMGSTWG